ncbi:3-phosphoshikimate 1-carboxyvinyltransferase [Lederbergia galactosidilytica]|uniref:3-phosphoshikimate 1-carboxyvinyltransferase n=1 Tax=Lederbergia galactosidilytica TaxID=217031 RepID=A0A177ZPA0_9BACI|nr:3-phosphoshikimate 1-carboxyvinyltransferase [Lederbergia galactosidilytica]KRG12471.1 3-phosphoshikimate 1-carboxyvinyltransferase [Virgibacillus soli]MBP1916668.1 3-phosphoshikimate 1-carboxyvinyltransferase [Lederbergia galactosidilytica]OAK69816.1 3-phosphoshikimate 1-carboxyvinyltransferase [Lederbergia galactosidilytica]
METHKTNIVPLKGIVQVPGDKSISHRSIMLGSIATGKTSVHGLLTGDDCLHTIECFKQLGVNIHRDGEYVEIEGKGLAGLTEPNDILDVGNSGTTIRLMLGILSSLPFHTVIKGDSSIAKRPMDRVSNPLRKMGAKIDGRHDGSLTPLAVRGGKLSGIDYTSPVASAQVKSAILLAGLFAEGVTSVIEPEASRDHTERMIRAFGGEVTTTGLKKSIHGQQQLKGTTITVPGDISSAAFFLVAGSIVPGSQIKLKNVGVNPTRSGILDILRAMGANITLDHLDDQVMEPYADLTVSASTLRGVTIEGDMIPRLIDEIPILALAATQAEGTTIIKDAAELKVKETNRIDTVVEELKKMGAKIEATADGMIIYGKSDLHGANVNSHGDHRIGMMLAIASCLTHEKVEIQDKEAITISYPGFFQQLKALANSQ